MTTINENISVFTSVDVGVLFLIIFLINLFLFIYYKKELNLDNIKEYILYLNNKFLFFIIMINSFIIFMSDFDNVSLDNINLFIFSFVELLVFYAFVTYSVIGLLYLISYLGNLYTKLNLFGNSYINEKVVNKRGKK